MPAIFYEQDIKAGLKNKRKLSAFIEKLVVKHLPDAKTIALTYIFCTDSFLLEMNKNFLDHDTYTDIITFDLSNAKTAVHGEIYISVERVRENAVLYNATFSDELHRVIFHGALHLCGFKDKKEKDRKVMRENEDHCLEQYKIDLSDANRKTV
jgi:probable rRNA maturation factor